MAKNAITVMQEGNKALDEINGKLNQTIEKVLAINDAAQKIGKNFFNIKSPKDLSDSLNKNKNITQQLNVELQERQRLEKALERQLERNRQAETENAKALAKARFETQQLNRNNKEAAILSSRLSTEYQKQSVRLTQLRRKYKDVALVQGESSKEAKRLLRQITALDNRLKRVDASVGQFQRSVGNYGKAMRGAVGAARNLAGAMGLLGGAFLVVRVFRDAARRVREFDKEMQNMAGILRTTRPELKELENRIISVAASSIKTSNEVAQLATSLLVLGKSKDDVLQLLEPVNDLSIALGATSEETGEFLVQTLNAFGKGSESAAEFADTIAAIRTSTSLDFQRMRDGFQYIAPISRLLNRGLAETGALVGVLADNGIKAEQASRLLATAEIKLATAGKTLEDALNELREAYEGGAEGVELLTIANSLFGKQAAKVGAVLATSGDDVEKYTERINKAGGSLDDLVNEQLKSMDAQLKITTSAWEEFVLSVENGEGVISKALGATLEFLTKALKGFTLLNKSAQERNELFKNQIETSTIKDLTAEYRAMGDEAESVAIKEADSARDRVEAINKEIKALQDRNKEIEASESGAEKTFRKTVEFVSLGTQTTPDANEFKDNEERISELSSSLGLYNGILKASEAVITQTDEAQKKLNSTNKEAEEKNKKTIAALRALIKAERDNIEEIDLEVEGNSEIIKQKQKLIDKYQAEIDAILGTNKARQKGIQAVEGSVAFMENEIKLLEEKQKKLAANSREYGNYATQIDEAKEALQRLKIELEGVGNLQSLGDIEGSFKRITDILTKPIEGIVNTGLDDIQDRIDANRDAELQIQGFAEETAQRRKGLEDELARSLIGFADAIFDNKIQKFEEEIQANNERYSVLLDAENLSEEQRDAIEAERDRKNIELEKKRDKAEKQAFLVKQGLAVAEIALNLAKTITAINLAAATIDALTFGIGGQAYRAVNLPIAIATAGLQTGVVLAQTIPQFEHGKNANDDYEGLGIWGERRQEVKLSKDGRVEFSPKKIGNHLTHVKKDDIILPDASKFLSNLSDQELYDNIHKHTILSSIAHQKNTIDSYLIAQSINKEGKKQTDRLIRAMEKNKTKVNLYNNIPNMSDDLGYLLRKQDSL